MPVKEQPVEHSQPCMEADSAIHRSHHEDVEWGSTKLNTRDLTPHQLLIIERMEKEFREENKQQKLFPDKFRQDRDNAIAEHYRHQSASKLPTQEHNSLDDSDEVSSNDCRDPNDRRVVKYKGKRLQGPEALKPLTDPKDLLKQQSRDRSARYRAKLVQNRIDKAKAEAQTHSIHSLISSKSPISAEVAEILKNDPDFIQRLIAGLQNTLQPSGYCLSCFRPK